jgi:hypothetical protein
MTMGSLGRRGSARVLAGRVEEGLADLRESVRFEEKKNGRESRNFAINTMNLCDSLIAARQYEEARTASKDLLETILRVQAAAGPKEWAVQLSIANSLLGQPRDGRGDGRSRWTLRLVKSSPADASGPHHRAPLRGRVLTVLGRYSDAGDELDERIRSPEGPRRPAVTATRSPRWGGDGGRRTTRRAMAFAIEVNGPMGGQTPHSRGSPGTPRGCFVRLTSCRRRSLERAGHDAHDHQTAEWKATEDPRPRQGQDR